MADERPVVVEDEQRIAGKRNSVGISPKGSWPHGCVVGADADRAWGKTPSRYIIGIWRRILGSMRSRIFIRLGPVTVIP